MSLALVSALTCCLRARPRSGFHLVQCWLRACYVPVRCGTLRSISASRAADEPKGKRKAQGPKALKISNIEIEFHHLLNPACFNHLQMHPIIVA
eukprot:6208116-Pleurochrysis_carterae.AAC.2